MLKCTAIAVLFAFLLPIAAQADSLFLAQIVLLVQKSDECRIEIKTLGKVGRFCQDFLGYQDYLFKGSMATFMNYHLSNGDINDSNGSLVLKAVKDTNSTMDLILSTEQK